MTRKMDVAYELNAPDQYTPENGHVWPEQDEPERPQPE